ncbi:TetR family transcriptional regulator [Gordonia sp. Z-3]|jgi:AcrR family transcriptional regulator/DNA-binding XRE family transcriptional regulator|uniref:TetR family transcriptional regulator n=2 Tax=Gordonia TaxID=2053 RepID=A0A9X3I436_9ACTN|nr:MULTISPECIES: TetR family transcriptional regulator [Gordonia]MDY6808943.1 TetR family transcriptional regulator [Actinomycetota bacterium]MAU82569.1 transcriptional regulator [Gordonia sp. (in: high G+C Gram-positive bacteria)]MCF3938230.1 TetR family transcriptional regulator [Gordonia tangerina]MCX2963555.1 TetR family transcriptional regulator [Gordonia aquimaris]MED5803254.1 TetR family transcriptional regulator [Gordonia sp. Z-3]
MAEQNLTGPAVRQARVQSGLTLRALAADIGVSVGTMSAIENGKVALTIDRLHQIARRLDVSPGHLVSPPPARQSDTLGATPTSDWRRFSDLDLDPALRAAVEVFTDVGYHGATMRLVATAADSSVAGIYHYHRSKQHLLVTLMTQTMADIEWRVLAADAEGERPAERFALMVEALALCHAVRRDLAFITATEMRSLEEPDRSVILDARRRLQARLDDAAVAAAADGSFASPDPRGTARVVATMCMALPYWFSTAGPKTPAEVAHDYADHALAMMLVQPR